MQKVWNCYVIISNLNIDNLDDFGQKDREEDIQDHHRSKKGMSSIYMFWMVL